MKWISHSDDGLPVRLFHGTKSEFERFDERLTLDGGLHFGTAAQASMRCLGGGGLLVPVYLLASQVRRVRDTGGDWRTKIARAKSQGVDAFVYLNRYEGISVESVQRAMKSAVDPDVLTDAEFRRWFPEASDSYVVWSASQVVFQLSARAHEADAARQERSSSPEYPDRIRHRG